MKYSMINNKMAKAVLVIILGGLIGWFSSCKKNLLDKKPLNSITEDVVFADASFLQNYVYNIYNGIKPPWSPGSGGYEGLTDVAVDQPETHDRAAGMREYLQGNISADNITDLTNIWNEEYSYIRKANLFFEKTETSTIDTALLNPMKGEVHFLRAWMYFELIRTYGGVPLITSSFALNDSSFNVPRNTYDECTAFVLSECETAITLLDGISPESGKISKAAAMALKARMLLYVASPLNNPANDMAKWQAAEVATKAVLDLGFYIASNV